MPDEIPLTVTFEETYKESREIEFNKQGISQKIVAHMQGNFAEVAGEGPTGLLMDDVLAIKAAYSFMPIAYTVPLYSGTEAILVISAIRLKQINTNVWTIEATYEVPQNGGKSGGGMGTEDRDAIGNIGPDQGENGGQGWSDKFTQISVNGAVSTRNRKFSLATLACQRSVNIPDGSVPYAPGRPAPMGHTLDGIEGAEVYEREFSFSITAYFPPELLKYAYIRTLSRLQTTMNREVFFGFPPGSVLFLEYDFSGDLYQVVPITFSFKQRNNFKFSQSQATLLANPLVDGAYDRYYEPDFPDTEVLSGWSEVDYRYLPTPDNAAGMMLQKPVLRIIHQLYEYSSFGALGL